MVREMGSGRESSREFKPPVSTSSETVTTRVSRAARAPRENIEEKLARLEEAAKVLADAREKERQDQASSRWQQVFADRIGQAKIFADLVEMRKDMDEMHENGFMNDETWKALQGVYQARVIEVGPPTVSPELRKEMNMAGGMSGVRQDLETVRGTREPQQKGDQAQVVKARATESDAAAAQEEVKELENGGKSLWSSVKEKIGGWFRKRETQPVAASEEAFEEAPTVKNDPTMPGFWSDLDKRFSAYVRGELTEAEAKGIEQDRRWVLARTGLETAASVFGVKVVTEMSRAYFTHQEYRRLQDAIKAADFVELRPGSRVKRAWDDRAKDVKTAIKASRFLSDEKKAELTHQVNRIMDEYHGAQEEAKSERDILIARQLEVSLEVTLRKVAVAKEAVNTLLVGTTAGVGRSAVFAAFAQKERMIRVLYEQYKKGEAVGKLSDAFREAAKKGFMDTAHLFNVFDTSKSASTRAMNFGVGALTIAKYVGLAEFSVDALSHKEAIDTLIDALDEQAPDSTAVTGDAAETADGALSAELTHGAQADVQVAEVEKIDPSMKVHKGDGFVKWFDRAIQHELQVQGVDPDTVDTNKLAAKLAQEKGLMQTWLSGKSIDHLALDVDVDGGEVKDVHFVDASTGQEVPLDELDDKGFTMERASQALQEPESSAPESPTEEPADASGQQAPDVIARGEPLEVTPSTEEAYFAVPGEDGTPASVEMSQGEVERIRVQGYGLIDIPESYSREEVSNLTQEIKLKEETQEAYKAILRRTKGILRFTGGKASERFVTELEHFVHDENRHFGKFLKEVEAGKAEVTELAKDSPKSGLDGAFEKIDARFARRNPISTERWIKLKQDLMKAMNR